jgi:glycosyltransferase involved in cell wall biosynthesis
MQFNIQCPINQLGYGITGYNICKALSKYSQVSLWPIGEPLVTSESQASFIRGLLDNRPMFNPKSPCIRVWHQHDMSQFIGGGIRIGFPIFELNSFNELERHHLKSVDVLFVCSKWAKNIIVSQLTENYWGCQMSDITHVIPLGVDSTVFDGNIVQNSEQSSTIFFNCGKWEIRKGHDILIDAFRLAFPNKENVQLWMMCENPFNSPKENEYWHNRYNDYRVKLLSRVNSQEEVYHVMRQVDCGVFPARAEGWNLEALEMMACGKQVIITDFSAHTEFCNKENSLPITIDDVEIAYDGKWFHGQGEWARIGSSQIEQISKHMRMIYEKKQAQQDITNYAGLETAKTFSWDNTAQKIMKALNV